MGATRKYLVIEDDKLFARGLKRFFSKHAEVVTVVETRDEAIALLERDPSWTGISIDVQLPGGGTGLDVLRWMREHALDIPAVVLTGLSDLEVVHTAQLYGASYICKSAPPENLLAFVRFCERAHDESWKLQCVIAVVGAEHNLTEREREVLLLGACGMSHEQIADQLGITIHTVRTYVRRILEKRELSSWKAAVADVHARVFRRGAISRPRTVCSSNASESAKVDSA